MGLKNWIEAARLRTLPLAVSCVFTGGALSWHEGKGDLNTLILTLATTLLLQILSNFANDYGDHESGVDNVQRVGPQRALQRGAITRKSMQRGLIVTALLTFLSGVWLLWTALARDGLFIQSIVLLAIGIASIAAAFKYTMGKNPYGYRGWGDLFVFLFFGLVGVCGSYFLYTKEWNPWVLLPAITIGLLSSAVLNLNNLRDCENDALSGKHTLIVKIGFEKGKLYHSFLVIAAALSMIIWMSKFYTVAWQWLLLLPLFIPVILLVKLYKTAIPASLDSELKKVALSAFLFSLLFFIGFGMVGS